MSEYDLLAEFERLERRARRLLAARVGHAPQAPDFRNLAEGVAAWQAVGAALREAGLSGPLDAAQISVAVKLLHALRAAYAFLGDSATASGVLGRAAEIALREGTRILEDATTPAREELL